MFEQTSRYEEQYLFETKEIFTKDEYVKLLSVLRTENEKSVRDIFAKVVESRLKIKSMGEDLQFVQADLAAAKDRYIVYFLEASAMAEMAAAPAAPSAARTDQSKFDIRNGFRFDLLHPETVLP